MTDITYSFGKNIERARLERESFSHISDDDRISIYKNGSSYKDYTMDEKYILYVLNFLSRTEDNELYFILETLLQYPWTPTDEQAQIEENMINDIALKKIKFYGSLDECNYITTAGDIILYFAKKIAYNTETSVASSCELLLRNMGIIMPADNQRDITDAWDEVALSDILDGQSTMFDQEFYDYNCSYGTTRGVCVPDWWEQYQYYLMVLIPES